MKKVLTYCNLPKAICYHVIGKKHTEKHQMIVGVMIMFFGVAFVKVTSVFSPVVHIFCDVIGYFIHGMGAIPFIKSIEKLDET